MRKIKVNLGRRSYSVIIGYKIIYCLGDAVKNLRLGSDAVIITNPAIYSMHKNYILKGLRHARCNINAIRIADTERSKSSRGVIRLIDSIVKIDKGRGVFIIAFGGGVVGDVAGFVASIYKRGIPYIQVPSTLLAQVDSSIGGKVAIDLRAGKNLVGAFYQPRLVLSDIYLLNSLPPRQIRAGVAEIIKYGIIKDKRLFSFLEDNIDSVIKLDRESLEFIISRSSSIKAEIVQKDEYDKKGIRAQLNFGHTIGHAIEAACGYSKIYSHGEAIGLGMIGAAKIAVETGLLKKGLLEQITNLIKKAGLPIKISKRIDIKRIMEAQAYDKKIIRGVNRFLLPTRIGKVKLYEDIPKRLIYNVIKSMQ